ncbi:stage II sporulation protein D [Tumebacillus permanentifrigoris]|uniref:Stage II sporulation protein D n=1 Tax=Tumebacillus permanentifrigoris TaxID=378543 RepID=A0A316DF84_9BACL|nr:stage II sporulation protein D [Tumebacillus permanentifrigoris]PWK16248.1 stage II sporulation protein D [Tumebacillus permanentifrigoris]
MNKKTWLLIPLAILALLTATILVPSALVAFWPSTEQHQISSQSLVGLNNRDDIEIKLYLKSENKVVPITLEKYVRGVVAAEMPVTFAEEALKAQAVAARTYIVRRLVLGVKTAEGADVSDDHNDGQAYSTDEKLQQNWGMLNYPKNISKINNAVNATEGQVLLYEGKPIEALFFSTSSGKTENSEDYWGKQIPYLRSVDSPWDLQSEKYSAQLSLSLNEFRDKLGITTVPTTSLGRLILPIERTAADHIKKIKVGDKTFSGPDFRKLLGLRSTMFTWEVTANTITFHTSGYGHDVGLSQYGADGMAKEGKKAQEILLHYYQGVNIGHAVDLLPKTK